MSTHAHPNPHLNPSNPHPSYHRQSLSAFPTAGSNPDRNPKTRKSLSLLNCFLEIIVMAKQQQR